MPSLQARKLLEPSHDVIPLHEETINRLDGLREDGQSYDELITELVNIYQSVELSLAHGGDAIDGSH